MIYRKNLYSWEQLLRIFAGLAIAVGAMWMMPASPALYALLATGAVLALTGVLGFCPMCAMVGRRPVGPSSASDL